MSASYIELQSRTPERTDRDSLFLLYRPLCGQDAVILYETLMSLSCRLDRIEPEQLLRLSGLAVWRKPEKIWRCSGSWMSIQNLYPAVCCMQSTLPWMCPDFCGIKSSAGFC